MTTCTTTQAYLHSEAIPSCLSTLTVQTDLVSTDVVIELRDKFGHVYRLATTTNETGEAIIDLAADHLPEGLLNAYAGQFDLSVVGRKLIIDNIDYDAVRFHVAAYWAPTPTTDYKFENYIYVAN